MHPRTLIRNAFADRLKTAVDGVFPTAAAARVYPSRTAPVLARGAELPAIMVYARDERINAESGYNTEAEDGWSERTLTLETVGVVIGEEVDSKLDDLALEMEAALESFVIEGKESARIRLVESDIDVVTENTTRPVGLITLVWKVEYRHDWRILPPGTRPHTVNIATFGTDEQRIITNDVGLKNPDGVVPDPPWTNQDAIEEPGW